MKTIHIHILQHVPFEGPALIAGWAEANSHVISYTRFWENFSLPPLKDIDWLVIMGGPMSVNEEDKYPWLNDENNFINKAVSSGKTVIGICLGAQLIAKALGSRVIAGGKKEIGWFPVRFFREESERSALLNFLPDKAMVFHWHGDTFDIPLGALHIASSEAFPNQAFLINNRVIGLQFHMEMDCKAIELIIKHAGSELIADAFVQEKEYIMNNLHYIEQNKNLLFNLLDNLLLDK